MLANIGDPDQTPHSAASDLGLPCLHMSHKTDTKPIWVNVCVRACVRACVRVCLHVRTYVRECVCL